MKKMNKLAVALASAVALGGFGVNAYAADGTGTGTATVVTPIAIAASSPNLLFGSFSTSAAGQTVAIGTGGGRTLTGALGSTNSAFGAASFAVTGDSTLTYAITLPSNGTVTLLTGDGIGATKQLPVTSFVSNPSGTGTLSGGAQTLLVGATITTAASQLAGAYTGTFTVTVAYN